MSLHEAGDVPSSSDSDSEPESSTMAEEKYKRASTEDKSPDRASDGNKPASKNNAKDPSRPRRKKARRACHACQRAHLTCGDERPCNRCIKRGLQDQCHDGVRKKAKYLHDAPPEALLPGYQSTYTVNGPQSLPTGAGPPLNSTSMSASQPGNYYSTVPGFHQYDTTGLPIQMSQQAIEDSGVVGGVSHAPTTSSPIQYQQPVSQQISAAHNISNSLPQAPTMGNISNPSFEASLFDPNDPTLFNFNPSDFNFGNHYGALEFGMLGHMTSGAVNTPEMEVMDSMNHAGSFSYDGTTGYPLSSFPYTQSYQPWQNSGSRQGSTNNLWALHHNGMDAFAVADTTPSLTGTSPNSQSQDWTAGYSSSTVSPETHFVQPDQNRQQHHHRHRQSAPFPNDFGPMMSRKAQRRDTKQIYASVTKGYPYTQRFHSLTAFLNKRFTTQNVLRIAEAMAAIRPSFIALTKGLSDDDLIFMEQGFQRQLVDYDDTWQQTGTPSIICRRTGEVVSCNKEFSLVTGWRRDVLLGKEPNLNANFDNNTSGSHTGSSSRGAVTPRIPEVESDATLPQPVFIAELLDQDSAVGFWEDFAERAFGASTSSMPGVTCTLMKYKTKDDLGWGPGDRLTDGGQRAIKTESGTTALGERDGRLDMSMTWLVRRDMFDIPMMIVINFLPMI